MLDVTNNFWDSESDDDDQLQYDSVRDRRVGVLGVDSLYYDLCDINLDIGKFKRSRYCAIHLNIQSLPSKYTELCNLLDRLKNNGIAVHFVLLCETFLTEINANLYPIQGYNFVHHSRMNKTRGGVAIYLLNTFNYDARHDISVNVEGEFESIVLEIEQLHSKNKLFVAEVYRVPNTNQATSIERYDRLLSLLTLNNGDVIMGSDLNFDLMKVNSHGHTSDLLDIFIASGALPTIKRPTRITHTSSTVIDNLFVKYSCYENIDSVIIVSDISDNFPIMACMGKSEKRVDTEPLIFYHRPISPEQIKLISQSLDNNRWEDIFVDDNVSNCYNAFINHLNKLLDTHAPIKRTVIPKSSIIGVSWMTPELLKLSRKRDILYRKSIGKSKYSVEYVRFQEFRNEYNKLKRIRKDSFYQQLLRKYNRDIRKTWQVLNAITGRGRNIPNPCNKFTINGETTTDKLKISDEFCLYFSNMPWSSICGSHSKG